jgi:hypothetical protein
LTSTAAAAAVVAFDDRFDSVLRAIRVRKPDVGDRCVCGSALGDTAVASGRATTGVGDHVIWP